MLPRARCPRRCAWSGSAARSRSSVPVRPGRRGRLRHRADVQGVRAPRRRDGRLGTGGVGVVDIRVTSSLGTSPAVPRGQFAYGGPAAAAVTGIGPDTGRAGDHVQIDGLNFASDVQVYFGDNLAEIIDSGPAQLVVKAPNPTIGFGKPSTINVTVLTNGYSSPASPADEFTYLERHRL
ncbi:IPT/TIG domain-containing protein [Streptomyces zaomyceticus]|uniref:IPT/TIG domain-containing protein n=1 Tax=Streptomyces zaomyceticus TaxID=68286 RepID=UPI002E114F06|nr:IPT/TIG domain-containing protein [Streptomyces zaomyceticus]